MPMTDDDQKRAADAIYAAMASSGPAEQPGMVTAQMDLGDVKKVFCEHWDTCKQVLRILGSVFPPANIVIGPVILAGDAAHKAICRGE